LTINNTSGTTIGTDTVTVQATSGSLSHTASASLVVSAPLPPGPPGNPGGGTTTHAAGATCPVIGVVVSWTAGSGATGYNIYRNTSNNSSSATQIASNINPSGLQYTDTPGSGTFYYWVQSTSSSGTSAYVPADTNASGPGISQSVCSGGAGPGTVTLSNGSSISTCGYVGITWTAVSGATGYNVYRNTSNTFSTATKIASNVSFGSQPYKDTTTGGPYYYWVTGIVTGLETTATLGASSPVGQIACGANMLDSDKNIIAVNGTSYSPNQCNGFQPSSNISLNLGDKVTFRIDLCNDKGTGAASGITITDSMINLGQIASVQYISNSGVITPITPTLTGTSPNQIMTVNLGSASVPAGSIAAVTFTAVLATPSGFSGTGSRFYNSYNISYNGTTDLGSVGLPFYTGQQVPTVKEVP
jgi:hypothetical protein